MASTPPVDRVEEWAPIAGRFALPVLEVQRAGFHLAGITCPADTGHVARRLRTAPGVLDIVLSPITEIAYVTYDPVRTTPEHIRHALDATGHGPATRWRP